MEGLVPTCGGRSGVSVVLEWGNDVLCLLLTDGDFLCKIESLKLWTKRFNPLVYTLIHYLFIIYILLLKVEFNGRFLKCNLDSMIKNIIINKSLFYLKLAVK